MECFNFPVLIKDVCLFFFFTGRGVFAIGSFSKGDFIVEYRGDLISEGEAQKRRIYNPACSGFLYAFKLGGKTWW